MYSVFRAVTREFIDHGANAIFSRTEFGVLEADCLVELFGGGKYIGHAVGLHCFGYDSHFISMLDGDCIPPPCR